MIKENKRTKINRKLIERDRRDMEVRKWKRENIRQGT